MIDHIIEIFVFGTLGALVVWFLWLRSVAATTNDAQIMEQTLDVEIGKQNI